MVWFQIDPRKIPEIISKNPAANRTKSARNTLSTRPTKMIATPHSVAAIVTSRGPGGMFARNVIPAVLIGLFALGWLRLFGQRLTLYGTEFGVAILVISSAASLTGVVMFYASRIDRFDRVRRSAEEEARRAAARMRFTLAAARMGAWEVDLASGRLTWSDTMAALFGLRPEQAPQTREAF